MKTKWIILLVLCAPMAARAQWTNIGSNIYNSNTGNVGIGTTTPAQRLEVVGSGGSSGVPVIIRNDNNPALLYLSSSSSTPGWQAALSLQRARGTYASPSSVLPGDWIGGVSGCSYINAGYRTGATIEFYAGPTISNTSYMMDMRFMTTGLNQTWRAERMRISPDGLVGINTTSPQYQLDVNGTINATGILINGAAVNLSPWLTTGINTSYSGTGNVGIGSANPDAKLTVNGSIHSKEVKVDLSVPGPDYVFEADYNLKSLEEIKSFIERYKHLPEVPAATEMEKNGLQLGEMNMLLLKKIEELTLHVIEINSRMKALESENRKLRTGE